MAPAPPLYVPVIEREDDLLAADVDERLVAWAGECGFEEPERFLGGRFGRLAMLDPPGHRRRRTSC